MLDVQHINTTEKIIQTNAGDFSYDYLVVATGAKTNYFGMKDVEAHAVPMKSLPQALDIRSIILGNLEKAYQTDSIEKRESLMNFVIVGAGPTGVEMAGALGELKNHILPHDYPDLDVSKMQIHVIEMQDRLLAAMSKVSSKAAQRFLEKQGVKLWLNNSVKSYDGDKLILSNGKTWNAHTVIWTAGVAGSIISGIPEESIVRGNRIKVNEFNQVDTCDEVYAIGDVAALISAETPDGHPMIAPVAIQQAKLLAKNLGAKLAGKEMKAFTYKDLGMMATVGRSQAVCDLKHLKFQGFLGWLTWLFIHLMLLVGFRNKVVTFFNWAWGYAHYDRSLRLIIRPFTKSI